MGDASGADGSGRAAESGDPADPGNASGPAAQLEPSDPAEPAEPTPPELFLEKLETARDDYLYGNYEAVIGALHFDLFPKPPEGVSEAELVQAYELLAASHYFEEHQLEAEASVYQLLLIDPEHELDPRVYPSGLIALARQVRAEHQDELDEILRARRETEELSGPVTYVERRVEERSFWVSLLPFGIGLFNNDEPGWGFFYLGSEVAIGSVSLGLYLANELSRDEQGFVPDHERAQRRQTTHQVTSWVFYALVAANILHGALIHQDTAEVSYRVVESPEGDGGDGIDEGDGRDGDEDTDDGGARLELDFDLGLPAHTPGFTIGLQGRW